MAKLRIGRDVLKSALDRAILSEAERATIDRLVSGAAAKGPITAEVAQLPQSCLKAMLDDSRLSPNQRAVIVMHDVDDRIRILHGQPSQPDRLQTPISRIFRH